MIFVILCIYTYLIVYVNVFYFLCVYSMLEFSATVWLWSNGTSPASWHFVTVSPEVSKKIKQIISQRPRKRWRWAVKVEVRIGFMSWMTSIFPESKTQCYLLPIKADVRKQLHIQEGSEVFVYVEVVEE